MIAGYRIGEDQSAGVRVSSQPPRPLRSTGPRSESGHERANGDLRVESVPPPTADIGRRPAGRIYATNGHWPYSLDHLVGASEQRRRNFEAERLGCLEVDHQLDLR